MDVSAWSAGEHWVGAAIAVLFRSSNVKFVYSRVERLEKESKKCEDALKFLGEISRMNKLDLVERDACRKKSKNYLAENVGRARVVATMPQFLQCRFLGQRCM